MDVKIGLMTGCAVATATVMRIGTTKIAVFAIAVRDADMMTVAEAAEPMTHPGTCVVDAAQMTHPDTCAVAEVPMTGRAICAVVGERMMALITSDAGVDAIMRLVMIAAETAASVMTAAPMIDAAMTGRIEIANAEEIQTIWQIASMTAIQPPTPLARVAGVGAVEAAVAEETTVPQAIEPPGRGPLRFGTTGPGRSCHT